MPTSPCRERDEADRDGAGWVMPRWAGDDDKQAVAGPGHSAASWANEDTPCGEQKQSAQGQGEDRPLIALLVLVPVLVVAAIGLFMGAVRLWRARSGVVYRVCAVLLVLVGLDLLLLVVAMFVGPVL